MHTKYAKKHPELVERIWALQNLIQTSEVLTSSLEHRLESESGVSLAENEVLVRLHQHGPRLTMHELASLLLLSKSGVTRLVDRLVEAGLVVREVSSEDRRVTFVTLTDDGGKVLERTMPAFARTVEEIFGKHLTDDEVGTLRSILRCVLEANGKWDERRCTHHAGNAGPHEHHRAGQEPATV